MHLCIFGGWTPLIITNIIFFNNNRYFYYLRQSTSVLKAMTINKEAE